MSKIRKFIEAQRYLLPMVSLILLWYYFHRLGFDIVEALRFIAGIVILYVPYVVALCWLLRTQVQHTSVRIIFSAVASFALNTLFFFALSVLGLQILYFVGHALLIAFLLVSLFKHWKAIIQVLENGFLFKTLATKVLALQWFLIVLVLLSLAVNIPIKEIVRYVPDYGYGTYRFGFFLDQAGQVSLATELDRHIPPLQNVWMAGTPQRAYHYFNGVSTVLLHRFTGEPDWLRVGIIYLYSILEILLCLCIYAIVYTLADSKVAGYLGLAFVYVLAAKWPPLFTQFVNQKVWRPDELYFTLFPYESSTEGLFIASSQAYAGLIPSVGVMLGMLLVSINLHRKRSASVIIMTVALVAASLLRFKLQYFIPLMPGVVLLTFLAWLQSRDRFYLFAIAATTIVTLLLYLEMLSPVYLPGSTSLSLTTFYDPIPVAFSAPFAEQVANLLTAIMGTTYFRHVVYVYSSLFLFEILNFIGLPVTIAAVLFVFTRPARHEFRLFTCLALWSFLISILGAPWIQSGYDHYSVGGQLPWSTQFYLFPFGAWAVWFVYHKVAARYPSAKQVMNALGIVVVALLFAGRLITFPSSLFQRLQTQFSISGDEMETLVYVREELPADAVILQNQVAPYLYSAISGRAMYYDSGVGILERSITNLPFDRRRRVDQLWAAKDQSQVCTLLKTMKPATHLLAYQAGGSPKGATTPPLKVRKADCLKLLYTSSHSLIKLYEIVPDSP